MSVRLEPGDCLEVAELRRRYLAGEELPEGWRPQGYRNSTHSDLVLGGQIEATAGSIPLGSATPQGSQDIA